MSATSDNLSKQVYKIIYGTTPGSQIIDLFDQSTSTVPGVVIGGGAGQLQSMFPNEFEIYACALELTDSKGAIVDFFSFPIMPQSMEQNRPSNSTTKKTNAGVVINSNPSFKPFDISLTGDFGGKKFKLVSPNIANTISTALTAANAVPGVNVFPNQVQNANNVFSSDYKSGYGCIKILERIIERARSQDQYNKPFQLFFYNLAFNSNYLVEPGQMRVSQNRSKNMVWTYTLPLKAIAPASAIQNNSSIASSLTQVLKYSNLDKGISNQQNRIMTLLNPDGQTVTQLESIINNQVNARLQSGLNIGQKSAIQSIKQLTGSPNMTDDFIVNNAQNILSTRF